MSPTAGGILILNRYKVLAVKIVVSKSYESVRGGFSFVALSFASGELYAKSFLWGGL